MTRSSLVKAALALLAFLPLGALAGASHHTFAWTHNIGTVELWINGSPWLPASNRGWVDDTGSNNFGGALGNYIAGVCGSSDSCGGSDADYHNYFAFDVANAFGVVSAELRLYQPAVGENGGADGGFLSPLPSMVYSLWDLSSDPTVGSGVALYADLGSGVSFGSSLVDSSSNGSFVTVALNAAGVAAINAAFAGSGVFHVGGAVSPVPEPASWVGLLLGLGLLGSRRLTRH